MKKFFRNILFLWALLGSAQVYANVPDSLSFYDEILDMYVYVRENPDSVMTHAKRHLSDEELTGIFRGNMHEIMGDGYYMKSMYDSAMYHLLTAEGFFSLYGSRYDQAWNMNYQGNIYMEVGKYSQAIEKYAEALAIFESEEVDDPWGSSAVFVNFASIQLINEDYENGLESLDKAISIQVMLDSASLPYYYSLKSEFYAGLGQMDSALYYINLGLSYNKKYQSGDRDKAVLFNGLAFTKTQMGQHHKALWYADSAWSLNKNMNDLSIYGYSLLSKVEVYTNLGNRHVARQNLDSAWYYVIENNTPSVIAFAIETEIDFYRNFGEWQQALLMSDSLISYNNRLQSTPIQELFLQEELKQEAAKSAELSETKKIISKKLKRGRNIFGLTLFVVCILAYSFYVANRNRKKLQRSAVLLSEKNARLNAQYELLNKQLKNLEKSQIQIVDDGKLRDRLIALISHDLRTPLTQIKMVIDLVEDEKTPENEKKNLLKSLKESSETSLEEINTVLESVRSLMQGQEKELRPISVFESFRQAKQLLLLSLEQKELICTAEIEPKDLTLKVNPVYLQSILRNLLSNAIKFSQKGGEIICFAKQTEREIILGIHDRGIGMPEEVRQKIFDQDQAHTSTGTHEEKGHGVGLTLVKEFARMNKARISCTSAIGEGTEITLHFPRRV